MLHRMAGPLLRTHPALTSYLLSNCRGWHRRAGSISLLPTHALTQVYVFTLLLCCLEGSWENLTSTELQRLFKMPCWAPSSPYFSPTSRPSLLHHDGLTWASPRLVQIPILVVFIFSRGGWSLPLTGRQLVNGHLVGDACRGV